MIVGDDLRSLALLFRPAIEAYRGKPEMENICEIVADCICTMADRLNALERTASARYAEIAAEAAR